MTWIDQCIGSLHQSTVQTNIVVVDNGSTDGTVAYIAQQYPDVVLLPQPRNLGFGQGNNEGIRYSREYGATHFLLLNQDAWIEPDMIERLLHYDDGHCLLSPIHMNSNGSDIDRNFRRNSIGKTGLQLPHRAISTAELSTLLPERFKTWEIPAALWLLPRSIIEEIGGFNPLFFHYAEDINYLQRLHFHHIDKWIVCDAIGHHCRENNPPAESNSRRVYQDIVLRAADINCNRIVSFYHTLRYGLAVTHTAIQTRKGQLIHYYIHGMINALKNRKQICNSRRQEVIQNAHWL